MSKRDLKKLLKRRAEATSVITSEEEQSVHQRAERILKYNKKLEKKNKLRRELLNEASDELEDLYQNRYNLDKLRKYDKITKKFNKKFIE